jgi:hypothetical protein
VTGLSFTSGKLILDPEVAKFSSNIVEIAVAALWLKELTEIGEQTSG